MGLKIGVIGAGSTYTPELVEGLLLRAGAIPVVELVLMDIDQEKLAIVGGLADRMARRAGSTMTVRLTMDRPGGYRGRRLRADAGTSRAPACATQG